MLMRSARPAPELSMAGRHVPPRSAATGRARDAGSEPASTRAAERAPAAEQLIAGWFREHVGRVWRIVARLGVASHSVEDIVQETFITASRRRADIEAGLEGRFLVATAVRLSANYRRQAHVRREVGREPTYEADASPLPDAEQLLIAKRSRERLDRLLCDLPEAQRAVFVLYELEGLSVPEIASLLELPLGTASSRVWRARARFSELAAALRRQEQQDNP
jgi:RNA polymerase sigma-70 factor, ECF subfamily